jgi:hypothetical protein
MSPSDIEKDGSCSNDGINDQRLYTTDLEKCRESIERSVTLSSSGTEASYRDLEQQRRIASLTAPSLNRSVTEVRDGIQNQRDPDLGHEPDEESQQRHPVDPDLVSWDSPDDPNNPKCWALRRKWAVVISGTFSVSPLSMKLGETDANRQVQSPFSRSYRPSPPP